jgi:hypothetical protein
MAEMFQAYSEYACMYIRGRVREARATRVVQTVGNVCVCVCVCVIRGGLMAAWVCKG